MRKIVIILMCINLFSITLAQDIEYPVPHLA